MSSGVGWGNRMRGCYPLAVKRSNGPKIKPLDVKIGNLTFSPKIC